MELIFTTTNPEKLKEAQLALEPFGHKVTGKSFQFYEPDEGSMEDIARLKLTQIKEDTDLPVFVDDSGIFFEAYNDFPGVLTRRFFQMIGYKGVKKLLFNENRNAYFHGVVAVKWRDKEGIFHGKTFGKIINEIPDDLPEGLRFPFDPIFIPYGETTVLAQMPVEKRIQYSYRKKALIKMGEWLKRVEIERIFA